MPRLELLPFDESHVPDAGRLLADRHRAHRKAEPLLSARHEDAAECEAEVAAVLAGDDASGAVAVRDGRVVGYLLGAPKPGATWGPNVWVESAGLAAEEAEDAARPVRRGGHAAGSTRAAPRTTCWCPPTTRPRSGRGSGSRSATSTRTRSARCRRVPRRHRPRVVVRRAVRDDIPALARLDLELPLHQGLAPTFSAGDLGSYEESVQEWEEDFDDPDFATFVAEHDGRVVGSAVGCPLDKSSTNDGLARPENAGFLGFAAVFPADRGLGAGRALGEAVLDWSREQQHSCVVTDWRATNLLSSRAWPALGFRPTYLRLHRHLGY